MKAEEIKKKLRRIPKDAEVYLCKDKGGLWNVLSDKEYKEIGGVR